MMVQLEDVFGVREQVEPARHDRTSIRTGGASCRSTLERWAGDERFAALARTLAQARGRARRASRAAPPSSARIPRATYRLQLHRDFTLRRRDRARAVPRARSASATSTARPILRARPGSTHGYDIVDHNALNPEIGTRGRFRRASSTTLHEHGMGQMLDIVPNHMGVLGADNAWWLDVLENGPASRYADFFDIDWQPRRARSSPARCCCRCSATSTAWCSSAASCARVRRRRRRLRAALLRAPLPDRSARAIRACSARDARAAGAGDRWRQQASALERWRRLRAPAARATSRRRARIAERQRDKDVHKRAARARSRASTRAWRTRSPRRVAALNGTRRRAARASTRCTRCSSARPTASRTGASRPTRSTTGASSTSTTWPRCAWRTQTVFEATHRLVLALAARGQGRRPAHRPPRRPVRSARSTSSACRPLSRCARRRREAAAAGAPLYVVIEKILAAHEQLPAGLAGARHDRLSLRQRASTALFVDPAARDARSTAPIARSSATRPRLRRASPALQARSSCAPRSSRELTVLASRAARIARADRRTRDFTLQHAARRRSPKWSRAFPVYRTYIDDARRPAGPALHRLGGRRARERRSRAADASVFDFMRDVLLGCDARRRARRRAGERDRALRAASFQQFTAPVDGQGRRGHGVLPLQPAGVAQRGGRRSATVRLSRRAHSTPPARDRAQHWPHTMLATSTHDNKRSEDVRARIDVLSEMPARVAPARCDAGAGMNRSTQAHGRRRAGAVAQRRVPALPDARSAASRRHARRGRRSPPTPSASRRTC